MSMYPHVLQHILSLMCIVALALVLAVGLSACESLPTGNEIGGDSPQAANTELGKKNNNNGKGGGGGGGGSSSGISVEVKAAPGTPQDSEYGAAHNLIVSAANDLRGAEWQDGETYYNAVGRGDGTVEPADYFGCPKGDVGCNKITATFTGLGSNVAYVYLTARHFLTDATCEATTGPADAPTNACMYDGSFENPEMAWGAMFHDVLPWISVDELTYDEITNTHSLTFYWQGQRLIPDNVETFWNVYPDLGEQGTSDYFSFTGRYVENKSSLSQRMNFNAHLCEERCWAEVQSPAGAVNLGTTVTELGTGTETSGRGRWATTEEYVEFTVDDPYEFFSKVIAIDYGTNMKRVVKPYSGGTLSTTYRAYASSEGCHEIRVADLYRMNDPGLDQVYANLPVAVIAWTPGKEPVKGSECT